MRVVFLTHYFPPEIGAAPTRIAALAEGLAGRGMQVTVHTGLPHYPSGRIPAPYVNRPLTRERAGSITIVRSAVYAAPNRGFARRLVDHGAFAAGALATAAASGRADVVVAETPPLFTAGAGVAYAAVKRAALAVNVSDLWPESAVELGALQPGGAPARTADRLARACYRHAGLIVTPTAGIVESLERRPEARGKVVQVPPAVDAQRFAAIPPVAPRADGPLRVLYAGTLGMSMGLGTVVDAAAAAGPAIVQVLVAGEGPEAQPLADRIAAQGVTNVRLLGPVAPDRVPALYGTVDAGIVPLLDRPIFAGALPTKLLEVMAAGRPAILAIRGEAAELVRAAGAGVVVAPEDPRAMSDAFAALRSNPERAIEMGRRGRARALEFDRTVAVERWAQLLSGLVDRRSSRAGRGPRRGGPWPKRGGSRRAPA